MRRVSPDAFLMPSAVTVMATLTSEGVVDFSTMPAVGVVCLTPAIVAVGIKPRRTALVAGPRHSERPPAQETSAAAIPPVTGTGRARPG